MSQSALPTEVQVAVIGGGQAGLAIGYYLQRAGLVAGEEFVILDAAEQAGGAWAQMWEGLRLFSPASHSSLPGWMMPPWDDAVRGFPPRTHVVDYLCRYEDRYDLAVQRRCRVTAVNRSGAGPKDPFVVRTSQGDVRARFVVSATGTWTQPFWPRYPGAESFGGAQLHTKDYLRPDDLAGQRVAVVGGGNSGAQILAEISAVAESLWTTPRPPEFLPDDVDGRALFAVATARAQALREGRQHPGVGGLGDIVMTPAVRAARDRGFLTALPMFSRLSSTGLVWPDGTQRSVDAIIWCTGFRPALRHLHPLRLIQDAGHPRLGGPAGTQSVDEPHLHLTGYADWSGPASATLIGAGRAARDTARVVVAQVLG